MSKRAYLYTAIFLSVLPFLFLFVSNTTLKTLANVTGLMGGVLLVWQFVLGNRFISIRLRENFVDSTKLHILLGTYGTLMIMVHPLLEMLSLSESFSFLFYRFSETEFELYANFGRTAFYIFLMIWVSSVILRKKMKYRPWLYIHYLTYPLLIWMFIHSVFIGTFINSNGFINLYWKFLMVVVGVGMFLRFGSFMNFGKAKYKLKSSEKIGENIYKYTFVAKGHRIIPKPGQFVFLRQSFFGEAHPYSVLRFDEKSGELSFGVKVVGRHSGTMSKLKKGETVYIDGPYGVFTREGQNGEAKVIFAGGIGVTPFVELVNRFGNSETYMFYANRKLEDALARDELKGKLGRNYVDILSQERQVGVNIESGRISKGIVQKYVNKKKLLSANIFLCGSRAFMDAVLTILVEQGVDRSRVYMEEFSL